MAGITSTKKIKGQPHLLAYITPNEVEKLKALGGQETMTKEGIPAYPEFDNYGYSSQEEFDAGDVSKSNDPAVRGEAPGQNRVTASQLAATNAAEKEKERQKAKEEILFNSKVGRNKRLNPFQIYNNKFQREKLKDLARKRAFQKYQDIEQYVDPFDDYSLTPETLAMEMKNNPNYGYDFSKLDPGKKMLGSNIGTDIESYRQNLYDVNSPMYGIVGMMTDKLRPDTQVTAENTLNKARSYNKLVGDPFISKEKLDNLKNLGRTQDQIDFINNGGGGGEAYIPFLPLPEEEEAEEEKFAYRFGTGQNVGADVLRGYVANGGRITRAGGGIMNAVPRQGYFLGKIVKGVGKAIGGVADAAGKVLKSDLGRYAIMAAGMYYGGGGASAFKNKSFMEGLKTMGGNFFSKSNPLLFTDGKMSMAKLAGISTIAPYLFGEAKPNEDIGMGTRGGGLIDPLTGEEGTPQSMRDNIELAKQEAAGDPIKLAQLNQKYNNMLFTNLPYENYNLYANGGRIAKAEGGLMDLGGMEKDYRAEGGFVPIGKAEKADDVPARLSVNEFVFTADAVRNAGGGDIDKGAEVMENMMKNLENGGTVSEESQGNTGAQEMFSVSERIGEVI